MESLPIRAYEDDDLLLAPTRADGQTRVRVRVPDRPLVVLGRGSSPEVELEVRACLDDGVDVARRRGGGCAVVLDPGNVVVSVAMALPGLGGIREIHDALAGWLVRGLEAAGVGGVSTDGVSDLVLGGRKVGGSCIARSRGLVLFSGTILVDPRVDLMERYLRHPPREPDYRAGRPHAGFIGRLGPAGDQGGAPRLAAALGSTLGAPPS